MLFKSFGFLSTIPSLALLGSNNFQAEDNIRKINPPNLGEVHIGKKILCYRPMRLGGPKFDIEFLEDKMVVHNYGHGGSGWTLGPGSARYVIEKLENQGTGQSKNSPVAVIGAGVIGLFSAFELVKHGYSDITIYADQYEDLTSHHAGGLFAQGSMDNDDQMQKVIDEIGMVSYQFYKKIALKQHQHFKSGARLLSAYFPDRNYSNLESFVQANVMQPAKDVILDFGNGTKRRMVAYDDGIFIDTSGLMDEMHTFLNTIGKENPNQDVKIKFVKKRLKSFSEVSEKVIVNCSGLGSRELNSDLKLIPVQGHLILLKDQNPDDLNHMIVDYSVKGQTQSGYQLMRGFYAFPKRLPDASERNIGVIGGTFIKGADQDSPNLQEFEIIIKRAKEFYGIKG